MQIICISRGDYGFSGALSKKLAENLGYEYITRESITDKATDFGIPVGKIEIDILKNKPITEELGITIDLFKAFVAKELCELSQQKGIVYHGRAGHLVLPGISNVLRVRAISDPEKNIQTAMTRMNLDRKQAKIFLEQTHEDVRRWVRLLYNEDLENPSLYDITVNAHHVSVESAAHTLTQFSSLPEFQPTPASSQTVSDILLAARCRLAIGKNDETRNAKVTVKAEKGNVTVTYLPRQTQEAKAIPKVLDSVPGLKSYVCTVASTNILFLGEAFDSKSENLDHLIDIAEKWNAAVELVRVAKDDETSDTQSAPIPVLTTSKDKGGILDENHPVSSPSKAHGIADTMDRLIQVGRAGSTHTSFGGVNGLVSDLSKSSNYSMIVVGDVYLDKGASRSRLKRDMIGHLSDHFHCPVLDVEDLKAKYLFGKKQLVGLIGSAIVSVLIFLVVFRLQVPILEFTAAGQMHKSVYAKAFASGFIFTVVPLIALIIGGFYHNFLKMIRLE